MLKALLTILFSLTLYVANAQHMIDTFRLYFDLNVAPLNKNTEKKIDLLIYNDKIINGSSVMVIGYADYLGSEAYNKNLSMQRAKNVRDYLVKYGISAGDIKVCLGKGEIHRKDTTDKEGNPIDRKVDIVVNNKVNSSEKIFTKSNGHNSSKGLSSGTGSSSRNKKDTLGLASKQKGTGADIKELTKLKEGQTLLLKNVYFPPGSHVIKPESYETIEKLVKILADNPKIKISIEGHVCCIHDVPDALDIDTNELLLSLNRAKAIFHYLVDKGINENRLQYVGFGRQHPIVYFEKNEEDADRNRRVEIRIVSVN
jgi:outer membrane protein OmpA-like peptidoglycan-associated protein